MNRRQFLAAAGALGAAACTSAPVRRPTGPSRIERIELFPYRYPLRAYFKFFTGPHGNGRDTIVVKVTDSDGLVGFGQSVPIAKWSDETPETAMVALREYFVPALLGHDPEDLEGAHRAMDAAIAPGFSTSMPIARAGIDIALHDLTGKRRGQSLAAMWGKPEGGSLTLSWTVNVRELAEAEPLVQQGWERGYRHFNLKVGPDVGFDVELARIVRRLAPQSFLWADANGGYSVDDALSAAPRLREAGVDVLEGALRPNQIRGWQRLVQQGALPIVMDEGVVSVRDLEEFAALRMMNGVAMKPARCGGLLGCRRQIEACERLGLMWLGSGLTDPDVSLAASVALYAAYGLKRPAALNGGQFLEGSRAKRPLVIQSGTVTVPTGAGVGTDMLVD